MMTGKLSMKRIFSSDLCVGCRVKSDVVLIGFCSRGTCCAFRMRGCQDHSEIYVPASFAKAHFLSINDRSRTIAELNRQFIYRPLDNPGREIRTFILARARLRFWLEDSLHLDEWV